MPLSPATERFVVHWGEMGSRWGVSRSMAQIQALLFLAPEPMDAEAIAEALGIARSNVSTSLRDLESWGLVSRVHLLNERREHFQALTDPYEIAFRIAEGRKKRELDPTLAALEACRAEAAKDRAVDPVSLARMDALLGFMRQSMGWYDQVRELPRGTVLALMKLGRGIARLVAPIRGGRTRAPGVREDA